MQITTLEPGDARQQEELAGRASEILRAGGLVVFPTETVYGVAASALSDEGVDRLRKLKQADHTRAFTVHIAAPKDIGRFAELTGGAARRLAVKAMPGPMTLLVEVEPEVMARCLGGLGLGSESSDRIYHDSVVGLRCPDHVLARTVLSAGGAAVIATSANLPGERPPVDAQQAAEALGGRVELVVDGGRCLHAKPSTIVKITGEGAGGVGQVWKVLREGVFDERYIEKLTRYSLMMVCTGNTCRSPMAEGIARQMIAEQLGIGLEGLDEAGIEITSAGAYASAGASASPEAIRAVAAGGIDISGHKSTPLTRELVDSADVIYCMTASHRQAVLELVPAAKHKTHLIDAEGDISDPYGADDGVYRGTAEAIRRGLTDRLKELPL
jgi:protein arginine phosphatase